MKFTTTIFTTVIFAIISLTASVSAADSKKVEAAKPAPFKNHWDAKSWDKEGESFWNEKAPAAKKETTKKAAAKAPKK